MRLIEYRAVFGEPVNVKAHPSPVSLAEPKIPVANLRFEFDLPHDIASMLYHSCRLSTPAAGVLSSAVEEPFQVVSDLLVFDGDGVGVAVGTLGCILADEEVGMAKVGFVPAASFQAPKGQLDRLRRALEAGAEVVVEEPDGKRVSSRELSRFLSAAVAELAAGGEVILLRGESEVSPAEAGELLGISRQFVDRLIDVGKLPARRLPGSRHRRLRVADVVAFGGLRDERQSMIASGVNAVVDGGAEY